MQLATMGENVASRRFNSESHISMMKQFKRKRNVKVLGRDLIQLLTQWDLYWGLAD